MGARARGCGRRRGGGGGSWGAGPRRPPGKRRGVLTAGPPGVIYMLSQPRADSWACSSLTGSLAHSLSAPATAQPAQPRGARERESQRAGEGGSKGGRERGRALALPLPCCPPFLLPQVRRAPLTLGKLRTALEPRVAPGGGGGQPQPLEEGEEEEEEVSPKDPLRAVCPAVSIRTQGSTARRGPSRGWLALGANFQLLPQLVFSRHPGVPSS